MIVLYNIACSIVFLSTSSFVTPAAAHAAFDYKGMFDPKALPQLLYQPTRLRRPTITCLHDAPPSLVGILVLDLI